VNLKSALNVKRSGFGTPFIWCHGLMSSMQAEDALRWLDWDHMPDGLELIRYDARGHGASPTDSDTSRYAWPSLADDMLAVADGVGAQRFIAGGASMGCATAIWAAVKAPERIEALILMIPPTIWEARKRQSKLYQRGALLGAILGGRMLGKLMTRESGRMLPVWMPVQADRSALTVGMDNLSRKTLADLFHGAAQSDLPPREALAALAGIPTLIIGWTGDATHPEASARELHALLPHAEFLMVDDVDSFRTIPSRIKDFAARYARQGETA
jgi:3-oxoadipate enol-lactonase